MSEEQIKSYYERIEKLLNGANKETYGFVPEEIRQILKSYEYEKSKNQNAIEYIENKIESDLIPQDISYKNGEETEHNYYVNANDLLEILKEDNKEEF